jgi:hypothetical protein
MRRLLVRLLLGGVLILGAGLPQGYAVTSASLSPAAQ